MVEQAPQFRDVEFMTAEGKEKVLKAWQRFIDSGFERSAFSKRLYEHLHLHSGFIAHFDQNGFYANFFEDPEDTRGFLERFDKERDGSSCLTFDDDFSDINGAMCQYVEKVSTRVYPKLRRAEVEDLDRKIGLLSEKKRRIEQEHGSFDDPFDRPPAGGRVPEESDVEETRMEDIRREAESLEREFSEDEPSPVRELPMFQIQGKVYFRDERLQEYRSVDDPSDRITFDQFDREGLELETPSRG